LGNNQRKLRAKKRLIIHGILIGARISREAAVD
jgi:hypothetical protein